MGVGSARRHQAGMGLEGTREGRVGGLPGVDHSPRWRREMEESRAAVEARASERRVEQSEGRFGFGKRSDGVE